MVSSFDFSAAGDLFKKKCLTKRCDIDAIRKKTSDSFAILATKSCFALGPLLILFSRALEKDANNNRKIRLNLYALFLLNCKQYAYKNVLVTDKEAKN